MKIRHFISALLVLVCITGLRAQMHQPNRYEIELGMFDDSYEVLSGDENGVLLYKPLGIYLQGSELWQFVMLDTTLQKIWKKEYYIDRDLQFRGYDYFDTNYYFLFRNENSSTRDLQLFQMSIFTGDTLRYIVHNLVPLELREFEVTEGAAVIGGYYNMDPVVIHYDFKSRKTKVLPGIFGNRIELVQVKINEDNSISVLVSARTIDKRNTLALKTYTPEGEFINSFTFAPKTNLGLIFGRVENVSNNRILVSGTYGAKRSEYSRGLFIASYAIDQGQDVKYYNYADFDNFFKYMKARQQNRVANRIARKKIKGKNVKFHYRLLVHQIIPDGENYILLGEAFYPKYTSNSTYGGADAVRGSFGGSNYMPMNFAGYRYTHAVVMGFNKQGKMLWDNSFEIEDIVTYDLNQYVHADVTDKRIVLLYLYNDEIRSKIIKGSDVVEGKSFDNVRLKFEDDVVAKKSTINIGGLEKWYGHTFYAFGVQKIKNMKDQGVKLNRKVFYINKVVYSIPDSEVSLSKSKSMP